MVPFLIFGGRQKTSTMISHSLEAVERLGADSKALMECNSSSLDFPSFEEKNFGTIVAALAMKWD